MGDFILSPNSRGQMCHTHWYTLPLFPARRDTFCFIAMALAYFDDFGTSTRSDGFRLWSNLLTLLKSHGIQVEILVICYRVGQ
jgi:hypothetical protein